MLAESRTGPRGVRIDTAILADPYVERGQARRRLFPAQPVISVSYLNQDPSSAGAPDWRRFFEEAGAKGKIDVRPSESHVSRWEPRRVAEFLGKDEFGESNDSGYTLVDFDIEPALPDAGAPEELRAALAPWLDDGFSVLTGKGRRRTSYFYYSGYSKTGSVPCAWVNKLSDLEWVPCTSDDPLRRPRDVLPRPDPAREDVPIARLSSELLSVLEQEGVKFGVAIPEVTALHRLSTTGSQLDAAELTKLLREVREQIETEEDRHHFERAVRQLAVPSTDRTSVPVTRIVRRTGGPHRGTLGGWILPLGRVHEGLREELEHPDFPYELPDTTTGEQALAYLWTVWAQARTSPERLANEVRDVLPAAYAYCLEDRAGDESLSERWDTVVSEAAVFAEREWVSLSESKDVYFDDLEDRRFFPSQGSLRVATGGHLGNSPSDRLRTADALRLPLLSSSVNLEWHEDGASAPIAGWNPRLDLICKLLGRVRGDERTESGNAGAAVKTTLRVCRRLSLKVSVEGAAPEQVPVNARLHRSVLTVAGRPVQFGADAAKELLRSFSFGQRGDLAADLTGMLVAIDNASDFSLAADKFRRSFTPDFELPAEFRAATREAGDAGESSTGETTGQGESRTEQTTHEKSKSDRKGGSFDRERALSRQRALARELKEAIKGEIAPGGEEDDPGETEKTGGDGGGLGDEVYRRIAAQYEKESGRIPELGDPHQPGWDLRSSDPKTGETRLIEVKGKGRPWADDEVVELSREQAHKAFAMLADRTTDSWYLYVVEQVDDDGYQVLPIENPIHAAAKWILAGESWRMVAEESRRINFVPEDGYTSNA